MENETAQVRILVFFFCFCFFLFFFSRLINGPILDEANRKYLINITSSG